DDTMLAVDNQRSSLVNVSASSTNNTGPNAQFKVVDLGKGLVALKSVNGGFVSVAEERVTIKELTGKSPGEPESFQWINLMRGDTMLMSLVNHRYLATKPNTPGPVTVTALGPSPARK